MCNPSNDSHIIPFQESVKESRAKEFLKCLGNGKTIYQIEAEEDEE
ncbi:MAG: hypothetical protein WC979_05370 [Candidatus Pacearchaeota archaeon]|jgi:hypothetical protein